MKISSGLYRLRDKCLCEATNKGSECSSDKTQNRIVGQQALKLKSHNTKNILIFFFIHSLYSVHITLTVLVLFQAGICAAQGYFVNKEILWSEISAAGSFWWLTSCNTNHEPQIFQSLRLCCQTHNESIDCLCTSASDQSKLKHGDVFSHRYVPPG